MLEFGAWTMGLFTFRNRRDADRLGHSRKDLIEMVTRLESLDIGLKSLHEAIDTSSSTGKLVFHLFGALAEFERNLSRERTQAGLRAARPPGTPGRSAQGAG